MHVCVNKEMDVAFVEDNAAVPFAGVYIRELLRGTCNGLLLLLLCMGWRMESWLLWLCAVQRQRRAAETCLSAVCMSFVSL